MEASQVRRIKDRYVYCISVLGIVGPPLELINANLPSSSDLTFCFHVLCLLLKCEGRVACD